MGTFESSTMITGGILEMWWNMLVSMWKRYRVASYNKLFAAAFTGKWYHSVLQQVADDSRLLDVGIGTGEALCSNKDELVSRNIRTVGVDIDSHYVSAAKESLEQAGLQDLVQVHLQSFLDHEVTSDEPYDAIHFASSFMLLKDQRGALRHAKKILGPKGLVIFAQTMEERNLKGKLSQLVKPLLTFLLRIDFGKVTYRDAFCSMLQEEGYDIVTVEPLCSSLVS